VVEQPPCKRQVVRSSRTSGTICKTTVPGNNGILSPCDIDAVQQMQAGGRAVGAEVCSVNSVRCIGYLPLETLSHSIKHPVTGMPARLNTRPVASGYLGGIRARQTARHCQAATSGSFRLERLPNGTCTHWKAPPYHGAHPEAEVKWPGYAEAL
jgi:hypothetical protein